MYIKKFINYLLALSLGLVCFNSYSWNSTGHRLIVQIAYNHLTPEAKKYFNNLNNNLDKVYKHQSLVDASVWLDTIHYQGGVQWYDAMHYVNKYFSDDGTWIPRSNKVHALWAINHAMKTIQNKQTIAFDKGVALRILIHVVGDIHQPLHGATLINKRFPSGDMGGNLYPIGENRIADNLHWYWDQGAGEFENHRRPGPDYIKKKADIISRSFPCNSDDDINSYHWLMESNRLAREVAYSIQPDEIPSKSYKRKVKQICIKRVAQAGCRLAKLLNQIDKNKGSYKSGI